VRASRHVSLKLVTSDAGKHAGDMLAVKYIPEMLNPSARSQHYKGDILVHVSHSLFVSIMGFSLTQVLSPALFAPDPRGAQLLQMLHQLKSQTGTGMHFNSMDQITIAEYFSDQASCVTDGYLGVFVPVPRPFLYCFYSCT